MSALGGAAGWLEWVVAAAVFWAAAEDFLFRRIPNASAALILAASLLAAAYGTSQPEGLEALRHVGAYTGFFWALGVLAVGFVLFMTRRMGAGDVKLAAVLALWCAADAPLLVFAFSLAGGVMVLGLGLLRIAEARIALAFEAAAAAAGKTLKRTPVGLLPASERTGLPYGLAIAAGYAVHLIGSIA